MFALADLCNVFCVHTECTQTISFVWSSLMVMTQVKPSQWTTVFLASLHYGCEQMVLLLVLHLHNYHNTQYSMDVLKRKASM